MSGAPPMSEICREHGGVWADGEPCGMDAPYGQRCDWHTAGVAAALAVAVRTGMVDLARGRLTGDPVGCSRPLATASIDCVVAVQRDPAHDADVARLLGHLAEHARHLVAYWDLVSVPGTDDTIARADAHRMHLRRLREELGGRLTSAGFHAALERYRATPGKRWPLRHQRHVEACDQPYDAQGRSLCGCPVQFDWEVEGA